VYVRKEKCERAKRKRERVCVRERNGKRGREKEINRIHEKEYV